MSIVSNLFRLIRVEAGTQRIKTVVPSLKGYLINVPHTTSQRESQPDIPCIPVAALLPQT